MRFSDYDEEYASLTDIALWWKTYQDHTLHEIKQLRGGMNVGMKKALSRVDNR